MTTCHVCGCDAAEPLLSPGTKLHLVSSDVRPVNGAADYAWCPACLAVQKRVTPEWQAMAEAIYAAYDINHQSSGAEPMVFDARLGSGPRSLILLRNLLEIVGLPHDGRLLDIGCSNGNLLKSFYALRPGWRLSGSELDDTWRATVQALPGVEDFYSGPHRAYRGTFDLISLSHVLEHIPHPGEFLRETVRLLSPGGRLLILTPNLAQNPIDLVIADHCTHFDSDSLDNMLRRAGLDTRLLTTSLLPKELVALVEAPSRAGAEPPSEAARAASRALCAHHFRLLVDTLAAAKRARLDAIARPFAVMGSSIAALATMLELDRRVDFFVDEDPQRIGHALEGVPIVAVDQLPRDALVFIPMSAPVARRIIGRWQHLGLDFRYLASNLPGA